jgi:ATPase subunit of ABC transporter with duplicated ATPase domains
MTEGVRLQRAEFRYDGGDAVLSAVTIHVGRGWTGVVGPNGAGKTTLLQMITTRVPAGTVISVCPQRVDEADEEVLRLAASDDRADMARMRRFGLDPLQVDRWQTLSAGERKRWQIAAALARDPDLLALDEPTNHLDQAAQQLVREMLLRFRGVGLLVSHDRALLDAVTTSTILVDHGTARQFRGGYTQARMGWEADALARSRARSIAVDRQRRVAAQVADAQRRAVSAAAAVNASSRIKGPRDSDGRSIGAKTLASWASSKAGEVVRRRRRELDVAETALADLSVERERGGAVRIAWAPSPRRHLVMLSEETLYAGPHRVLRDVSVNVERTSRILVSGANGTGKTTLLTAVHAAAHVPPDRMLYLPQEVAARHGQWLTGELRGLDPATRGRIGQLLDALGLDPDRTLRSQQPSPGEVRKLTMALGLARQVWLAILDEPTNHLDLPSIERLEAAFADFPGALVLASHDAAFARRLTNQTWHLESGCLTEVR